jgi:Na+-transporting methylmalonyl-CoA/oxaloacetate decarboxylase gamma subunit
MQNLQTAFEITFYGMGLVFIGILLLWAMMSLMVRLFSDRKKRPEAENTRAGSARELENKRLAAAIAVSTAIEMHNTSIQVSSHKERESISAWQAAHRSRQLNQNRSISSRKR